MTTPGAIGDIARSIIDAAGSIGEAVGLKEPKQP